MAFEFFNEFIKPVLAEDKAAIVLGGFGDDSSVIKSYLELAVTIRRFQNFEGYEANMESFKNVVIKTLKPELFEKLFESFMAN